MNRLSFIVLPLIVVAVLPCLISAAQQVRFLFVLFIVILMVVQTGHSLIYLQPTSIADKIEPITSERQQKLQQLQQQQAMQNSLSNRSPFLDTLFNVINSI